MLQFRKADQNDVALISELASKIWHVHYPAIISLEQIDYMLGSRYSVEAISSALKQGESFFLALTDDKPCAYASFETRASDYFLNRFYLDVDMHRGGIGRKFFDYLLTEMRPAKAIRLQVNRANYKAVNFYFKMGFAIESVGDFDIGGGFFMNDFIMVRKP